MKSETVSKSTTKGRGQTFPKLNYSYSYTKYENIDEVKAANNLLSDEEQVTVRNAQRKQKADAAAKNAAMDKAGIVKKTIENDDLLRLNHVFDGIMASKMYDEKTAREMASNILKLEWPAEDEDEEEGEGE